MNYNDVLCKRIIELREKAGETQQQLADAIGVTRQTLTRYELSMRTMNTDILRNISQHFGVSADYLLGLSDVPSTEQDMKNACEVTGLSEKAVENIIDISSGCDIRAIEKIGLKVNPVAETIYRERKKVIEKFFESAELKDIVKAVSEAAAYMKADISDRKTAESILQNLTARHASPEEEQKLRDIYNHNFAQISKAYTMDAYEAIKRFTENFVNESDTD